MGKLKLHVPKTVCNGPYPRPRREIVSNIKNWIWGDIKGTFDYAIKHGYLKKQKTIVVSYGSPQRNSEIRRG